jgi:hypothetical protein
MSPTESCFDPTQPPLLVMRYKQFMLASGELYCRLFHDNISHPVNGRYTCWSCHRQFPVLWQWTSDGSGPAD